MNVDGRCLTSSSRRYHRRRAAARRMSFCGRSCCRTRCGACGLWGHDGAARPAFLDNRRPERSTDRRRRSCERLALHGLPRRLPRPGEGFADGGADDRGGSCRALLGVARWSAAPAARSSALTPYVQTLHAHFSDDEWEQEQDRVLHPLVLEWRGAFGVPEESPAEGKWRWCGSEGTLRLVNASRGPRRVVLKMECSGLWDQTVPSRLVVDGDLCRRELSLTAARLPSQVDLDVPKGPHPAASLRRPAWNRGRV